jgi:phytoene dehydrogenase-like protein
VLAFAPYDWFRRWEGTSWKRRGKDYDELKDGLAGRLLEQLYRHVPQVRSHVDHCELSTPLSNRHFANYASGEPYGINHTPRRFRQRWLRPATPASAILRRPLLPFRQPRRPSFPESPADGLHEPPTRIADEPHARATHASKRREEDLEAKSLQL